MGVARSPTRVAGLPTLSSDTGLRLDDVPSHSSDFCGHPHPADVLALSVTVERSRRGLPSPLRAPRHRPSRQPPTPSWVRRALARRGGEDVDFPTTRSPSSRGLFAPPWARTLDVASRRRRHSSVEDRCSGLLLHALRRSPLFTRGGLAPSRHGPASFVVSSHAVATAGCGVGRVRMRSLLTPIGSGFTLLTPSCFRTVARGSITLPAIVSRQPPGCRPERGLDELGHLASRRLGRSSNSAPHWVRGSDGDPSPFDQRLQTHDLCFKERVPAVSVHSPTSSLRGRSSRFHAESSLRRAGVRWERFFSVSAARAYLWRFVVSPSSVAPSARCLHNALEDRCSGARAVPRSVPLDERSVRDVGPRTTEVTVGSYPSTEAISVEPA